MDSSNPDSKSIKGLKAEAVRVDYDANRIDELIEQSRRQLATLVPISDRLQPAAMWRW